MSKEHDITKGMLERIRLNGLNPNPINESEEGIEPEVEEVDVEDIELGVDVEETEDVINLEGQEFKDEQNKFMDIVTANGEFAPFKIYPNSNNAIFGGKLDNGIEWQFSKVDGLYVNMPNIKVDDEIIELLKKLNAHYVNWAKEWGKKLNTEYRGDGEV